MLIDAKIMCASVVADYCHGVHCRYNGKCENDVQNATFRCICQGHFAGTYCEIGKATHQLRSMTNLITRHVTFR